MSSCRAGIGWPLLLRTLAALRKSRRGGACRAEEDVVAGGTVIIPDAIGYRGLGGWTRY